MGNAVAIIVDLLAACAVLAGAIASSVECAREKDKGKKPLKCLLMGFMWFALLVLAAYLAYQTMAG